MTERCDQKENIAVLSREQQNTKDSLSAIINEQGKHREVYTKLLENQETLAKHQDALVQKLDSFFSRLEIVLITDVERKKDIDVLGKEHEVLFERQRSLSKRVTDVERILEGANVSTHLNTIWDWYQQERGWRRLIPSIFSVVSAICAVTTVILLYGSSG